MMRRLSFQELVWLDLENPKKEDMNGPAQEYALHPLNIEDSLSKRQLSKVEDHDDHIFILFHYPIPARDGHGISSTQISFFLGANFLISIHDTELESISRLFNTCEQDSQRRGTFMKSSARLLYHILDGLVDNILPFLQKVEENLEEISDLVFDERKSVAAQLSFQRRAIVDLRRIISPLRRIATDLALKSQRFSKEENLSEYFGDVIDHIEKTWETLEQSRETIEIYKDTDSILSIETTNKVLSILTIVSTLTIPAVVIGTIYGMNIPMPGAFVPGPPTFLGVYTTFWLTMAASIVPALALLMYFRRRGWL